MNFIDFRKSRINRYLIPFIFLLFFLNTISSFDIPLKHQKKADEQNIAILDLNSNANILSDAGRFEKKSYDKIIGISNIRSYYDNSVNIIFKIYPETIKNSLSNTNSANAFLISLFSTDT